MISECRDCGDLTENIGSICAVCLGKLHMRALELRRAAENHRPGTHKARHGILSDFEGRDSQ
jgi:hypothetical protein